jgi:archaellum biogenesis protein FlaJ (TadC family)
MTVLYLLRCLCRLLAHRCRCQRFEFTVAVGGTADVNGHTISANFDAIDQLRHWAAKFAVMHNAAFAGTVW